MAWCQAAQLELTEINDEIWPQGIKLHIPKSGNKIRRDNIGPQGPTSARRVLLPRDFVSAPKWVSEEQWDSLVYRTEILVLL